MMKFNYIISMVIVLFFVTTGCSDFLEDDQQYTKEEVVTTSGLRSRGLIDDIYTSYDYEYTTDLAREYLTDNAVSNLTETTLATGGYWGPTSNPYAGIWQKSYDNMRQIYQYIDLIHNTGLAYIAGEDSEELSANVVRRYYGEAFFLKAWAEWELLKIFGGPDDAGNMLGFPIVNEILENDDYATLTRDSYDDCVAQIMSDLDVAIDSLDLTYSGTNTSTGFDVTQTGRASGLAAYALKAKVALFAASPAFNPTNDVTKWEEAVAYAHEAIMQNGGLKSLKDYDYTSTTNVDHIWRMRSADKVNDLELLMYPSTLYGQGVVNPSQNFVDAFPDSKGYPISLSSEYDAAKPYTSRDARFYKFIFFNNDSSFTAETASDYEPLQIYQGGLDYYGGFKPAVGTRTGYYLKKYLNNLDFDPSVENATIEARRVYVQLGLTELYLNYAEAANEAYGTPDVAPAGYNFSAKEALAEVRKRAGITTDDYLDQVSASSADFKTLLKNERRIEMSFSGERFHDLRRWNEIASIEDVRGMQVTKNTDGTFSYQVVEVESRNYEAKNSYLPLPYDELILNSNLKQNQGWE